MWSLSLVMSEWSLSWHGQGHVSNFYIVDLENFATASRRQTGDIHNSTSSVCLWHLRQWKPTRSRHRTSSITHCLRLNLQLHTIDLVRTCRISSFCTVAWQLARFQLTRRISRSLGDSWATCVLWYDWSYIWYLLHYILCRMLFIWALMFLLAASSWWC